MPRESIFPIIISYVSKLVYMALSVIMVSFVELKDFQASQRLEHACSALICLMIMSEVAHQSVLLGVAAVAPELYPRQDKTTLKY